MTCLKAAARLSLFKCSFMFVVCTVFLAVANLHDGRDDEGLAVETGEEEVGGGVTDELFGVFVEAEFGAELICGAMRIDADGLGVFEDGSERVGDDFGFAEGGGWVGEGIFPAESVGDVAEVAEGAGVVAFEDVGVLLAAIAAADGVNEVFKDVAFGELEVNFAEVLAFALSVFKELALADDAGFEVEFVIHDAGEVAHFANEAAGFKDELSLAVIKDGELHVGGLGLVGVVGAVDVASADGDDGFGEGGVFDGPAGDVHLMNALIAHVAVAEVPEPVPVVVDEVAVEGLFGGGAKPEVEVHVAGDFFVGFVADAPAGFAAVAFGDEEFAVFAAVNGGDLLGPAAAGAALGAVLDDAVVFAGGFNALAAFEDVVAAGFLDVDVFAGLASPDGDEGMPVVGRGDGDGVDVVVFQELADVVVDGDFGGVVFFQLVDSAADDVVVNVAESGDADAGNAAEAVDVVASASVDANNGDSDVFIGAEDFGVRISQCQAEAGADGVFDEVSTVQFSHESKNRYLIVIWNKSNWLDL